MRILLQQKDSGLYFKEAGVWTADVGEAADFLCSTQAIDYCHTHHISGAQLVLKFDEEHAQIIMPMTNDRRATPPRPN